MEDEVEEGEISASSDDDDIATPAGDCRRVAVTSINWPPGRWRLGQPYKNKASLLFLRFATKGKAHSKGPGFSSDLGGSGQHL